ncbi:hypothetical protein UFOVP328_262 [uncultured Caudovirales phage]|uniref:Uncharacterized protein n=1 Tax=uncultured Caudovirales phage TaxID=2100421 RepID=A0A6J5M212_9CAUD|nr:hypothetical protein UFOVP328_262 [uncultured Caudovirales phage]
MITSRYRTDYEGEFIITQSTWSGGKKRQTREWVANPIENHHISGRAVCIGSDVDSAQFDYTILQRHRGGLLGSKKLQTYGLGNVAKQMRLDFAVETDDTVLKELIDSEYYKDNVVYTTPRNCLKYPGYFYLTPYNPVLIKHAISLYLAAFDGHKEIFLLGYTQHTDAGNTGWTGQIADVISAYSSTKFVLVGAKHHMVDSWLEYPNVEHMIYRDFITYCDV